MRALAQSTAGAVAASVAFGLLGSSTLTVQAQPVSTATPDAAHAIYVDSASPDRNEQFLCGKTVVVMYNGLRYSNAQLAVAHTYSLPTTISLFGNLTQAAHITEVSPPAGASGGPNQSPAPESRAAADAVRKAIRSVNAAQKLVATLQKQVTLQAATVEGLVLEADRAEIVREAALGNNTSDDIVRRAHTVATSIDTTKWWPTSEIIDAVQDVQLAKATTLTPDQTKIVGDLAAAATVMLKQMTDQADATTLTMRSLIAWKQLLGKIRSGDFVLDTTVRCPPGAYADNAAVSFVAVDRTLAVSAPVPNGNASGITPAGGSKGAGGDRTEFTKPNPSSSNATQNASTSQKQSTSISKAVAVVNAPSRLSATQGVGYSAIPNETFQTGTTLQNGANVTQVQNARSDAGQAFLMTTLVHYRFNNPGPIGIHATVGLTTSKNQLVNGVAGASLSFNQAMYFTVGVFRADTTSLTGYSAGQIVPSGTTLPTKSQAVNRVGFAISIPIFPAESGKGTPPATPAPATPAPQPPKQ